VVEAKQAELLLWLPIAADPVFCIPAAMTEALKICTQQSDAYAAQFWVAARLQTYKGKHSVKGRKYGNTAPSSALQKLPSEHLRLAAVCLSQVEIEFPSLRVF